MYNRFLCYFFNEHWLVTTNLLLHNYDVSSVQLFSTNASIDIDDLSRIFLSSSQ